MVYSEMAAIRIFEGFVKGRLERKTKVSTGPPNEFQSSNFGTLRGMRRLQARDSGPTVRCSRVGAGVCVGRECGRGRLAIGASVGNSVQKMSQAKGADRRKTRRRSLPRLAPFGGRGGERCLIFAIRGSETNWRHHVISCVR